MWPFKKSPDLATSVECFERGLRYIQVTLFKMLTAHYSGQTENESASVTAAQVVNYLKGEDVECVIASTPEPLKSEICRVEELIPDRARDAMALGRDVREVVVATLRMRAVLSFGLNGEHYFQSDECRRIEGLLSVFGPEFPREIDPSAYLTMARRFRDNNFRAG